MPCYHPLRAYRSKYVNQESGKRSMVFSQESGLPASALPLPCGKCYGCRLEYSRQWAMRILHEKQLHDASGFLTLTYAPEHVPAYGTLVPKDFTDFMKRLRARRPPRSVHYYMCGEYGEVTRRPHYHAVVFGVSFQDAVPFKRVESGVLCTSAELSSLWPVGFSTVGEVTFESAAYVARYVLKKLSFYGEASYEHIDPVTGEVVPIVPEYSRMSLRPAVGKEWFKQFGREVYPSDEVIMRGKPMKPPKYYDKLLELENPESLEALKLKRLEAALEHIEESSSRRLRVREQVKIAQAKLLKRGL